MKPLFILILLSSYFLSDCSYSPPFDENCKETELTHYELFFTDSLERLTQNTVFLDYDNYSRYKKQLSCENPIQSYSIQITLEDTLISKDIDSIHELSLNLAMNLYKNAMSDTLKCFAKRIEVTIGFSYNSSIKDMCTYFKISDFERFLGENFFMQNGVISIRKIKKRNTIKPYHGNCHWNNI